MQRLKAIEQAPKNGHWHVDQHLEPSWNFDVGFAGQDEVQEVVPCHGMKKPRYKKGLGLGVGNKVLSPLQR